MPGVQEVVPLTWHNSAGNTQYGAFSFCRPFLTNLLKLRRGGFAPPFSRQIYRLDFRNKRIVKRRFNDQIPFQEIIQVKTNQNLKNSKRNTAGRIYNWNAGIIPASAEPLSPLAGECRSSMSRFGNSKSPHDQENTPCSRRPTRRSTSRVPISVVANSSGVRPEKVR